MAWGTVRWQMVLCGELSLSLGAITLLSVLCSSRGGGHLSLAVFIAGQHMVIKWLPLG